MHIPRRVTSSSGCGHRNFTVKGFTHGKDIPNNNLTSKQSKQTKKPTKQTNQPTKQTNQPTKQTNQPTKQTNQPTNQRTNQANQPTNQTNKPHTKPFLFLLYPQILQLPHPNKSQQYQWYPLALLLRIRPSTSKKKRKKPGFTMEPINSKSVSLETWEHLNNWSCFLCFPGLWASLIFLFFVLI